MAGCDAILEEIPPGLRLNVLHYHATDLDYPGDAHGYLADYYLYFKAGYVAQNLGATLGEPLRRQLKLPGPPWGDAGGFDPRRHLADYDGFLVRIDPARPNAPFDDASRARLELVHQAGNFRYYGRAKSLVIVPADSDSE